MTEKMYITNVLYSRKTKKYFLFSKREQSGFSSKLFNWSKLFRPGTSGQIQFDQLLEHIFAHFYIFSVFYLVLVY
jgi:hypothetical protein